MHCDMVAEDLGVDSPVLQLPIQRLVMRPHPPLPSPIFCRIRVIPRTFDFAGVVAVPLVGLHPLARLEEITQNLVENFNDGILTSRVWPLGPHQVPREDVNTQLVAQGRLPSILVGREGVPLRRGFLLGDAEVGSVNCHRAVVEHIVCAQSSLEDDLWRWRRRRWGGEDGYEKKVFFLPCILLRFLTLANIGSV